MSAGQPPLDSPEIRRLTPVIGPGYTYGSVTDKISAVVLTRPTSLRWDIGFLIDFSVMGMMTRAICWLIIKRTGLPGVNIASRRGVVVVRVFWLLWDSRVGTST